MLLKLPPENCALAFVPRVRLPPIMPLLRLSLPFNTLISTTPLTVPPILIAPLIRLSAAFASLPVASEDTASALPAEPVSLP